VYQSSVLLWIYPAGTVLLVAVRVSYRSAWEAIRLAWLLEDIIDWRYVTYSVCCLIALNAGGLCWLEDWL